MSKKRGNALAPFLIGASVVAFFIAGFIFWQTRQNSGQPIGPYTPAASESKTPTTDTSWANYRNDQLGFSLDFPKEKDFVITTAQNKVSFFVPFTENGFSVTAYANPKILESQLWLEENFGKFYQGLTFKGLPLSYRDVRVIDGAFLVGDLPKFHLVSDTHVPLIFKVETANLERTLADKVLASFAVLDRFEPIDPTVYENKEKGIRLVYPTTGMVEEKTNGSIIVWQDKDKREIIPSEAPPGTPHMALTVFANDKEWENSYAGQEKLKEKATEFTFLGEKPLILPNGLKAVEYSFETSLGRWIAIYVFEKGKIYRLNYEIAYGTRSKQFFDQITSSLELL